MHVVHHPHEERGHSERKDERTREDTTPNTTLSSCRFASSNRCMVAVPQTMAMSSTRTSCTYVPAKSIAIAFVAMWNQNSKSFISNRTSSKRKQEKVWNMGTSCSSHARHRIGAAQPRRC